MPVTRLLVAVDFSAPSLAAAKWATTAMAPGAHVVLAHVVDVPRPPRFLKSVFAPIEQVEANAVPGATRRLEELRETLDLPDATVDVRTGRAFKAIHAACEEHRAELLVIGPHGDRTGLGRLLGSTAERAVRESPCPVMIASGAEATTPRKIVAAVDDSDAGQKALDWAATLARQHGAELIAVHVVDAMLAGAVGMTSASPEREKALGELRSVSDTWLHQTTERIDLPPGKLRLVVRTGHPADEVVNAAREAGADVVVIGRNATGLNQALGSIADFVIRANTTTTVVIPG